MKFEVYKLKMIDNTPFNQGSDNWLDKKCIQHEESLKDSNPGANTINKLCKNIYFLHKSKYTPK